MKLITKVAGVFDGILDFLAILSGVLVILLMLGISADVFVRYSLNSAIFGLSEIAESSLLFITFLASAWVLKKERHVILELVLSRLKSGTQTVLNISTSIIAAIICFVLTWYGVKVTWESFQQGYYFLTELETPKFLIQFVIPLGSSLLFIQFLRRANRYLMAWRASSDKESKSEVDR